MGSRLRPPGGETLSLLECCPVTTREGKHAYKALSSVLGDAWCSAPRRSLKTKITGSPPRHHPRPAARRTHPYMWVHAHTRVCTPGHTHQGACIHPIFLHSVHTPQHVSCTHTHVHRPAHTYILIFLHIRILTQTSTHINTLHTHPYTQTQTLSPHACTGMHLCICT